jgi:hypothetical protein
VEELLKALSEHVPADNEFKLTLLVQSRFGMGACEMKFDLITFNMLFKENLDYKWVDEFFQKSYGAIREQLIKNMASVEIVYEAEPVDPLIAPNVVPYKLPDGSKYDPRKEN